MHKEKIGNANRMTIEKFKKKYGYNINIKIYDLYWNKQLNIKQVAEQLGLTYQQIYFGMHLFNIRIRTPNQRYQISELIQSSLSKIRKGKDHPFYGCNHTEESRNKIKKGRKKNPPDLLKERRKKIEILKQKYLMDFEYLFWYWYFDKRKSFAQISKIIGFSLTHTKRLFKQFGFKARNSSESHQGIKQSKELIEKRMKAIMDSNRNKPNKKELQLINIIKNEKLPYKFVGDGKIWINGKNPDFINTNHQKKIIEFYGNYWHRDEKVNNGGDGGQERKEIFAEYGYTTLIIWEGELENEEKLLIKIKEFEFGKVQHSHTRVQ